MMYLMLYLPHLRRPRRPTAAQQPGKSNKVAGKQRGAPAASWTQKMEAQVLATTLLLLEALLVVVLIVVLLVVPSSTLQRSE